MNEYHRTIISALRDHGARDVRLVPGGRHPHVDFVFRDKSFNLAVHHNPPGHSDAAIIKVKELRTMLGEPDVAAPREARRLDDMTLSMSDRATSNSLGGVAMYLDPAKKLRLRFFLPDEIATLIDERLVDIQRMSQDMWLVSITEKDIGRRIRREGRKWQLNVGNAVELTRGYSTPFGVTPAEYAVVDGKIMIRLLTDQIRPIEARKQKQQISALHAVDPPIIRSEEAATSEDLPTTANGARWVESTMPDPRAVLAAISKIEAATPYRLVKLKEVGWAWQAPTIKLEP